MRTSLNALREDAYAGLAGSALVSAPGLADAHFQRSIILLAAHHPENGAFGIVLNKPTGKRLAQVKEAYTYSALGNVPVYSGGPVEPERLVLTAWQRCDGLGFFKLHFGLSDSQAEALIASGEAVEVRAFQGVCGWEAGQLEQELVNSFWLPFPLVEEMTHSLDKGEDLWAKIMGMLAPELLLSLLPQPKRLWDN